MVMASNGKIVVKVLVKTVDMESRDVTEETHMHNAGIMRKRLHDTQGKDLDNRLAG